MENKGQNAPKLTPEQAKTLKGMINLSKYARWIFFASILAGVVLSILSGVLKETMGDAMLLLCAGVFVVTLRPYSPGGMLIVLTAAQKIAPLHLAFIVYSVDYQGI